ncbi:MULTISPECIES: 4'-phosphopantetheinyl transferase family protein [Bradyrhizobium]|uniref:Phosphopantetheinyl transferase n=1 Tax=Bradyrhizobium arachidis TaxID=858423 RepID=A0AAE7NMU9_9BRAD|nr:MULTISPECIES: 4'-phosphopantetheinyl transferase superfamily protein [Bradyrhizobium]QOG22575.1 4'-phosphopantetheinyl transferase superfamily protein [Bradyrhizobium sp. SEMIA]QOZ68166.1 phosphopantetheinyl transferase [Bradyrhizobium arachidis]UFW52839.1 4'-phosphopantetheinyl transferase superfamily protein [Bradyrhizobium arachidis]SFV18446.1 4'-phosphopantetheinyl transferase [Bradyrhizobium arachidis]
MSFRIKARAQNEWEKDRYGVGGQDRPGHKPERGARKSNTALSSLLDKAVELRPRTEMPVFENDGLEILTFMLDVEPDTIRRTGACLNDEERRRAQRLRLEQDRRRFIVTRGQLRRVLASKLGISPSDVELEYGRLGKPHLSHRMPARDLHFSVSRSADVAVIALSTRQEIGVDIEAILPVPEADEIAALCLSASEYESYTALGPEDRLEDFLRHWTRLEAISKALGCGLGQRISWDEKDWVVRTFVPKSGYIGNMVVRK